jgi:hypothetical protein
LNLQIENLEHRVVPGTSGVTWPDGMHTTLSFVPDGTHAGGGGSNLFFRLDGQTSTALWQREILRAFEAWAGNTNINVGVTGDDGSPFGTPWSVQGEGRLGDVRIGAIPLPEGTLATNTSFQ